MSNLIEKRKSEHIRISLKENIKAQKTTTGFEDIQFIHNALPDINRDRIHLHTQVFNHTFKAPILVGAMTGGTPEARKINRNIADSVEELGLGMGVGSQRAAIEKPILEPTYRIVRERAPNAFLIANIGAPQIVQGYRIQEVEKAVAIIEADALAIHLNPLQEAIQPEGEVNYEDVLRGIEEIVDLLPVPIIVKETGAGISADVAKKLEEVGVKSIDVSGAGGTSWAAVEFYRAQTAKDLFHQRLGETFWDWGIPTVASLVEVAQSTEISIIASGGVRTGVDVAKSIALGASLTSISTPILQPATKNSAEVKRTLRYLIEELRNTMFLVGARSIAELRSIPLVIMRDTATWLKTRGFQLGEYARR